MGIDVAGRETTGDTSFGAWREQAWQQVQQPDWPVYDREAWRGTTVEPWLQFPRRWDAVAKVTGDVAGVPELPCRVVVANGRVADHGELPAAVGLGDWQDLTPAERATLGQGLPADGFTALNQAAVPELLLVRVRGIPTHPVHVIHYSEGEAEPVLVCPRAVVMLAPGSHLTLVTEYRSSGVCGTNGVLELHLAPGSQVEHYLIQQEAVTAVHLLRVVVHQPQDSHYRLWAMGAGAGWSRCEVWVEQTGAGATTQLRGLSLVGGQQHNDMHSVITHHQPRGVSRQVHKCVVAQQGQAVFHGTVRVKPAAQGTDAGQINRNLLLSKQAKVDTRPQLAIQADEVQCTHGATVSDLDPEMLFYLQSRGLDTQTARLLLVEGFVQELVRELPFPTLRQSCQAWMHQLTEASP